MDEEGREPGRGRLAVMLAGGGARAAYQVGVLRGIGRRLPDLEPPILTGVSAGAINVGFVAAHRDGFGAATEALGRKWRSLTTEEVFRSDPLSLLGIAFRWGVSLMSGGATLGPRARGLVDTAPLRHFLDRAIDPGGIEANVRAGKLAALALSAVSFQTGRTVTFVHGRGPIPRRQNVHHRAVRTRITVDHIMASAAIPLLFPAVKVGQQYYGDGSFRQVAPLAPAIHLGAERILAISARYDPSRREARTPEIMGYPPPARIIGLLFNSAFLDILDWDAARLERINLLLERLPPAARRDVELRPVDLLVIRPSQDIGRLAAAYQGRMPRTLRFFVRGLGTNESRSADFVSYMLFESLFIERLMELGERDADEQWERIEAFLRPAGAGAGALPAAGAGGAAAS